MSQTQILECMVAIGGDEANVVHRGEDSPVTYPEMLLLQYVHGDDAVFDAFELGREDRDNADELTRLRITYGARAVADVFPGTKPRLPLADARIKVRKAPTPPKKRAIPTRGEADDDDDDNAGLPVAEADDT